MPGTVTGSGTFPEGLRRTDAQVRRVGSVVAPAALT